MKHLLAPLACCVALCSTASAQLSDYLGPGVLTHGAGDIGNRSGEQVDLRFYVDVNGVYDNGLTPISVDSKGNLAHVGGLYGVEAMVGVYGSHSWRTALLGLDYRGDFTHYAQDSYFDGSDQSLIMGYTYQKSRRLYFDFQGTAGTFSNYLGGVPGEISPAGLPTVLNASNLLLFDNRTDFLDGTAGMTYLLSPRLSMTLSGDAFWVHRQSAELIGMTGYGARAQVEYRLSRTSSVGLGYNRNHFQYPSFYGNTDLNVYSVNFSTRLGPLWTFTLQAGMDQASVVGIQTVALDPVVAAILGITSTAQRFSAAAWIPSGDASLSRKLKNASLYFDYNKSVLPGNGVYLTSRSDNAMVGYSYSGTRKATFGINGGYMHLSSVGQGIQPYHAFDGGVSMTYAFTRAIHGVARYDLRNQDISSIAYRRNASRVTLGIAWSPGNLPLSLW